MWPPPPGSMCRTQPVCPATSSNRPATQKTGVVASPSATRVMPTAITKGDPVGAGSSTAWCSASVCSPLLIGPSSYSPLPRFGGEGLGVRGLDFSSPPPPAPPPRRGGGGGGAATPHQGSHPRAHTPH